MNNTMQWNFKQIQAIVNTMLMGGKLEKRGCRYFIEYLNFDGKLERCSNASKSTVKEIIEQRFHIKII